MGDDVPGAVQRRGRDIWLAVSSRGERVTRWEPPVVPWTLAALAGGAAVALGGLLVSVAVGAIAWLGGGPLSFESAAGAGVKFWMAANGAPISLGALHISIIPLGFTALLVLLATGAAGFAGRQARARLETLDADADVPAEGMPEASDEQPVVDDEASESFAPLTPEQERERRVRTVLGQVVGLFAGGYLLVVLIAGVSLLEGSQILAALAGGAALSGGSALWAAGRSLGWQPTKHWPVWLRTVPLAIATAVLTVVALGAVVLGVTLAQHWRRVAALHDALAPGTAGSWVLLFVQLAYLLNLVLWCASWALGGGVALGQGSLLTPATTHTGLLPSIPLFGGVPANGVVSGGLWWLFGGVLAGALAAVIVSYARRRARFDETALAGGLAGVASALVLVGCCWLANGGLGTERLTELGARLGALTIISASLLGLSGLVAGLVVGLIRGYDKPAPSALDQSPDSEHYLDESEDGTEMSFR